MSINLLSSGIIPINVPSVTTQIVGANLVSANELRLYNQVKGAIETSLSLAGQSRAYNHSVSNSTIGGLNTNHLQCFSYGLDAPVIAQCYDIFPNGIFCLNRSPLDSTRMGTTTGTGSAVNVAVPTINATSTVVFSIVGTTNAGGFAAFTSAIPVPTVVITAGTGFAVTATSGLIYNYEIIG